MWQTIKCFWMTTAISAVIVGLIFVVAFAIAGMFYICAVFVLLLLTGIVMLACAAIYGMFQMDLDEYRKLKRKS